MKLVEKIRHSWKSMQDASSFEFGSEHELSNINYIKWKWFKNN